MDEDGDRNVRRKLSLSDENIEEVDRLGGLPACLIFKVLLNLPTKIVVKTSVLSTRWRKLWRHVPGLYLCTYDFPKLNDFVSFVDKFLGFNSESCLQKFKLMYNVTNHQDTDTTSVTRWINTAVNRKVQHLFVWYTCKKKKLELPSTVYTCESLVSLELYGLTMPYPKLVSLPSLKDIFLHDVKFSNDSAFEMLISSCSVLEGLTLFRNNVKVLLVRSKSLLNLSLTRKIGQVPKVTKNYLVVAIDAPRLKCLNLTDHNASSIIIKNTASLVVVNIKIAFNLSIIERKNFIPNNDRPKRNTILDFLIGISSVKVMNIVSCTLEVISRFEGLLPLFCNLLSLHVDFYSYKWEEVLPVFLERCPNLKSLSMRICKENDLEGIPIVPRPQRFLTYLKYVKIEKPLIVDEPAEMRLAEYILENSTILKKFTLCLNNCRKNEESVIRKKLLTIPRRSISCQIVVL